MLPKNVAINQSTSSIFEPIQLSWMCSLYGVIIVGSLFSQIIPKQSVRLMLSIFFFFNLLSMFTFMALPYDSLSYLVILDSPFNLTLFYTCILVSKFEFFQEL